MSEVTVANLHEQSSLTTDLLREDDPAIQQGELGLSGPPPVPLVDRTVAHLALTLS